MCVCACGDESTSKGAETLPVWKEKWDWSSDVTCWLERGREKKGRLDSIKPKLAGKVFGILHFFGDFFGEFLSSFVVETQLYTWFKDRGLALYRVVDSFSVFAPLREGELNVRPHKLCSFAAMKIWKRFFFVVDVVPLLPRLTVVSVRDTFACCSFSGF